MGNNFACCRLTWTSFTNSEEDIAQPTNPSAFQFINHGAIHPNNKKKQHISNFVDGLRRGNVSPFVRLTAPISVQHISEREPEDELNPSLNALNVTLFFQSMHRLLNQNIGLKHILRNAIINENGVGSSSLCRSSSCGSVFIGDGCLSKPNLKVIFRCVSVAIFCLLKSVKTSKVSSCVSAAKHYSALDNVPLIDSLCDQSPSLTSTDDFDNECTISSELYHEVYELYDERVHPIFKTQQHQSTTWSRRESPDYPGIYLQRQILDFLNQLFSSSLLTIESAIVALVYVERLISGLQINIVPWSWRRQLLSCILLACKVLDDQAVWNADYCQLLNGVHVEDLNELERHTLSLLQFNTCVPPSVYAKYYFDLLTVDDLIFHNILLTQRKKMTIHLARQFGILALSQEERFEYYSDNGAAWGGGIMFDLACAPSNRYAHGKSQKHYGERLVRSLSLVDGIASLPPASCTSGYFANPSDQRINLPPNNNFRMVNLGKCSIGNHVRGSEDSYRLPTNCELSESTRTEATSSTCFSQSDHWRKKVENFPCPLINSNFNAAPLHSNTLILNEYSNPKVNNCYSRFYDHDLTSNFRNSAPREYFTQCNVAYSVLNDSSLY